MKKKVAFLENYSCNDYKGGIANILECYISNLDLFEKNNFNVDWVNLGYSYSKNKICNLLQKINNLFWEKRKIFKKIKKTNINIVHIHTSRGYTLYKDLIIAKYLKEKMSVPIIVSIHFADIKNIFLKNRILKKKELKVLRKYVDKIICLSNNTVDELSTYVDKKKIEKLYTFHSFGNHIIKPIEANKSFIDLMFMGSIDERKGIIDLIKALGNVKCDFHLKIFGGFNSNHSIEKNFYELIEKTKNVEYCGYLSGKEKENAFIDTDVFILPSYSEGMPIVIMEALATGCAIISTKVGGIPDIVGENNGILINPGDINGLSKAIEKMALDKKYLSTLKENNFKKGLSFSLEKNIDDLCNIYKGVLNVEK